MAEFFTKNPIFQGRTEIEQLEIIFKTCGSPNEKNWPEVKELSWSGMINFKEQFPRTLEAEFGKIGLSLVSIQLLDQLLQLNPTKRPTCAEALSHPYFMTELPHPCPKSELPKIEGDWHEFEGKQRRKKPASEFSSQSVNAPDMTYDIPSSQYVPPPVNSSIPLKFREGVFAENFVPLLGHKRLIIEVSKSKIGLVIGPQGSKLQEMERNYSVDIQVMYDKVYVFGKEKDAKRAEDEILLITGMHLSHLPSIQFMVPHSCVQILLL